MGLLDALFSSDTYGGQGGGLLDLIRQTQSQNIQPSAGFPQQPASFADRFNAAPNAPQPFQPSGGRFDQANYDPQTYAPNQAQPISVGNNYQMPRMGAAPLFAPQMASADSAAIPPNAQPTQGQLAEPAQQQLPPPLGGNSFGGNIGASLQSFANTPGGLINKLAGGTSALLTGERTDPQGLQQQNLKAQYDSIRQALIANGETPQAAASKAMVAAMNPEAAKTIIPELFTSKTEIKMVKDAYGAEHPYSWNPRDQTFRPVGVNGESSQPGGDVQGMTDKISSMAQAGATRQEMLKQVPAEYRGHVDAVLSGRALPANIGRSGARAAIMATAHAIDPNFDESTIPLRFKTSGDYAPNGQSGRSIVALNTVQHHIGKLSDDVENLGDTGWTILNGIRNGVAVHTPLDPKQGVAVQAVQDDIKAVTDEMSAAYKAGKVSDHEIEAWNKLANSNMPVRQLKQGIHDFVGLLNGKRDQLNETHNAILGRDAPGINKDLNETITKKVKERNTEGAAPSSSAIQEGATATNPQTGAKITFRGGKWQ